MEQQRATEIATDINQQPKIYSLADARKAYEGLETSDSPFDEVKRALLQQAIDDSHNSSIISSMPIPQEMLRYLLSTPEAYEQHVHLTSDLRYVFVFLIDPVFKPYAPHTQSESLSFSEQEVEYALWLRSFLHSVLTDQNFPQKEAQDIHRALRRAISNEVRSVTSSEYFRIGKRRYQNPELSSDEESQVEKGQRAAIANFLDLMQLSFGYTRDRVSHFYIKQNEEDPLTRPHPPA